MQFEAIDRKITGVMARLGPALLRYSLGLVFVWFGLLKPLGISPEVELIERTVYWGVDPQWLIPYLGYWEVAIGVCLLVPHTIVTRIGIFLMFVQMPGTFLPLIILPDVVYTDFPYGLTLEGQYIVKNLVMIAAALVVGARVRDSEPERSP